jgi:uncharacterized protein YqgV (UPF0045/DUF77 family)
MGESSSNELIRYNSPWSSTSCILGRIGVEFSGLIHMYAHEKEREIIKQLIDQKRKNSSIIYDSLIEYKYAGGVSECSPNYIHSDWFKENDTHCSNSNKLLLTTQLSVCEVENLIDFLDVLCNPGIIMHDASFLYEPFQRLIILEVFVFIVKKFAYRNTNELFLYAKDKVGVSGLSEREYFELVEYVDKKHSVHIIPRRHGKTRIFSIVMAAAIICLRSIKVAYICHSSKLISATFQDIVESVEIITRIINEKRLNRQQNPVSVLKLKDKKITTLIDLHQPSQIEFIILHNALVSMNKKNLLLTDLL